MSKTIEELASEYYLNEVINGDTCDDKEGWTDCFVSGAEALMQLPLSSRLTAEEKEMIKRIYKELKSLYLEHKDRIFRWAEVYKGKYELLESIFGSDFFKKEE